MDIEIVCNIDYQQEDYYMDHGLLIGDTNVDSYLHQTKTYVIYL